jgi:Tfp pilus assembly protein PilE
MSKKLKSFTLVEVLVGMIITGIVISLATAVYQIIWKQTDSYKKENGLISEQILLQTLLKKDFLNAAEIKNDGDKKINFLNEKNEKIKYEFNEKNIVRVQNFNSDTFSVAAQNLKCYFREKETKQNAEIIDELSFEVVLSSDELITFHFVKEYDAAMLMQTEKEFLNNEH